MAESQNSGMSELVIARQRHSKHVSAAMNQYATTKEMLEVVFSVWSAPRLYNEDQQPVRQTVKWGHESCGTWSQESPCWRGPAAI
jgi:hypothetical protein